MTTYSLNGHTLIGVIVPEGSTHFTLDYGLPNHATLECYCNRKWVSVGIPPGQWEIIGSGLASEITEAAAEGLVESVVYDLAPSPGNDYQGDWSVGWREYGSDVETGCSEYPYVLTSVASLRSWLLAHGLEKNCTVLLILK